MEHDHPHHDTNGTFLGKTVQKMKWGNMKTWRMTKENRIRMPSSPENGKMRAREVTESSNNMFEIGVLFVVRFFFLGPAMGNPRGA